MSEGEPMEEHHERVIETIVSETGQDRQKIQSFLDLLGLDVTQMTEEDADALVEAWEGDDDEEIERLLLKYDVPQDHIDQVFDFNHKSEPAAEVGGNDASDGDAETSPDAPPAGAESRPPSRSDAGMSEAEVRQVVQSELNDAMGDLKSQIQSLGNQQAGDGGGMNQTQAQALQLARAFLENQQKSEPSPFAQMGEEMAKMSMWKSVQRMQQPTFGERVGQKVEESLAERFGEKAANDMEDQMPDGVEGYQVSMPWEDNDDDDSDDDKKKGGFFDW